MSPDQLPEVLGRIARVVAESLDLKEVFARVADAAAEVLPYDHMIVLRAEPNDLFALHSFAGKTAGQPSDVRLDEFSPGLRELLRSGGRIDDLAAVLDLSFPLDRKTRDDGMRSCIAVPILRAGRMDAIVAVAARRVRAFTDDHENALRMIADLVGLALEHERLWTLDVTRRRRLDAIDALLPAIAQALDVRAIFNQVSTIVRPVLAHDRLMLASLSEDRRTITVDALSGEPVPDLSRTTAAPEACSGQQALEPEVVPDIEADTHSKDRCERARILGVRAMLRIPMRLTDGRIGALLFLSKAPGVYSDEDVVIGRRVTDYVSLALSHQRLAEEERLAAEAHDRAARLEERVAALREELETSRGFRLVVGESLAWTDVLTQAAKVAPTETTVLVTGESGTGKEVVARLIHRGSARARGPFVALNCAALQETLLESELFGHEKGAFTGATSSHAGSVEQAAGGVLFLDEVGEMSRPVQAKLLRVLQEREFQRLGSTKPMRADVRVVAATNRDLSVAIARGEFREDLYYRLHVFEIHLPPLRERRDDVLALAETFLVELGHVVGRPAAGISKDAREVLLAYAWPGNVRELRNVLERATILCDGGLITAEHLPRELGRRAPAASAPAPFAFTTPAPAVAASNGSSAPSAEFNLDAVERDAIVRALEATGNNRSQAARLLGIARPQLYHRLKKFGLEGAAANGE
jgi:transcriptional regulator with GAF, ATPase, and Fis domain